MKTYTFFCLLALCSSLAMLVTGKEVTATEAMTVTEQAANHKYRELKKYWWPKGKGTVMKSGMYYKMNVFHHGYSMNGKGVNYKGKGKGKGHYYMYKGKGHYYMYKGKGKSKRKGMGKGKSKGKGKGKGGRMRKRKGKGQTPTMPPTPTPSFSASPTEVPTMSSPPTVSSFPTIPPTVSSAPSVSFAPTSATPGPTSQPTSPPSHSPTSPPTSRPSTSPPTVPPTTQSCWQQVGSNIPSSPLGVNPRFRISGGISLSSNGQIFVAYHLDLARVFGLAGSDWAEIGQTTNLEGFTDPTAEFTLLAGVAATRIPAAVLLEEDNSLNANFAFLRFDMTSSSWSRCCSVDLETIEGFGDWLHVLSGDGNVVAVASHGITDDTTPITNSEVQIYTFAGNVPTLRDSFSRTTVNDVENDLGGGMALSFDGSSFAMTDYIFDSGRGQLQVFSFDGSRYNQVGSDILGSANELFGWEAFMSGDGNFVAGTYYSNFPDGYRARIFRLVNGAWQQVGDLPNEGGFAWSFDGQHLFLDKATYYQFSSSANAYVPVQGREQVDFLPADTTNLLDDSYSVSANGRMLAIAVGAEGQPGTYQVFQNVC